jgi:hypothetical protein
MADDRYFGYTSASNTQLNNLRMLQHHVGEDLIHYPQSETSLDYSSTPNWKDPKYQEEPDYKKYQQNFKDQAADTIEKIRYRILGQDVTQIDALSQQWFAIVMIIENLSDSIANEATALRNGGNGGAAWTGPASDAFLARGPGAALKSLDDWKSAAVANWLGLSYLSSTVVDHQSKMTDLYNRYKAAMVSAAKEFGGGDPEARDEEPDLYVRWLRKSAEPWHAQAQELEFAMAQGYWQVINSHLNGGSGTIFEGPTNAVKPDPKFMGPPPPTMPNLGTAPNLGAMPPPPNLPDLPPVVPGQEPPPLDLTLTNPDLTPPPDPSQLPSGLTDGQVLTNPAGQAPGLDLTLTAGLTLTATAGFTADAELTGMTGSAPGLNGLGGGMGNLARGMTPPAMPPKLKKGTLSRSAAPGEPEGGPGRGAPATPGALRNRANKAGQNRPGAPGLDEGEEFGRPGQTGTPPVLRGRSGGRRPDVGMTEEEARLNRSGTPVRPGAAPPVLNRKRPDKPGTAGPGAVDGPLGEEFGRSGQPGTASPVLRGSRPVPTGPEEVEPPARAVRGAVRGRSAAAEQQEMTSRRKTREEREKERIDREFAEIQRLLGDEEPWTVATPGGAVLDNAPERAVYRVEPKPTLGGTAST